MVVVKQLPRQSGSSGDGGSSSSGSNGGGSRSGSSGVGSGVRSSSSSGGNSRSGSSVAVAELKQLLGNNQKLKVSEREELQFTYTKENL